MPCDQKAKKSIRMFLYLISKQKKLFMISLFDVIIRKLSRSSSKSSLPPSYSTADLHTLAMSVQDYLYPPPDYKEIYRSAQPSMCG
jgi:hypothetical protein